MDPEAKLEELRRLSRQIELGAILALSVSIVVIIMVCMWRIS